MPLPGILGGFETRQKHFFSHFLNFFPGKIGIFPKNRRFFAEIFLNDFSMDFSFPLQPITEKSADFSDFLFPAYTHTHTYIYIYIYIYMIQ